MDGVAGRSVLVNYMERRKVFKIPPQKNTSDVLYLTGEFKKEFSMDFSDVIFQRFDEAWDLQVDLEPDDSINDKDKLVAVVIPKVSSATSSVEFDKVKQFVQILCI